MNREKELDCWGIYKLEYILENRCIKSDLLVPSLENIFFQQGYVVEVKSVGDEDKFGYDTTIYYKKEPIFHIKSGDITYCGLQVLSPKYIGKQRLTWYTITGSLLKRFYNRCKSVLKGENK